MEINLLFLWNENSATRWYMIISEQVIQVEYISKNTAENIYFFGNKKTTASSFKSVRDKVKRSLIKKTPYGGDISIRNLLINTTIKNPHTHKASK